VPECEKGKNKETQANYVTSADFSAVGTKAWKAGINNKAG